MQKYELKCDKCHKETPVRINGLCQKCRDSEDNFENHDLSVANEDTSNHD